VVEVAGRRHEVELGADGVRVDGAPLAATLSEVPGTPVRQLSIGDAIHRVVARRGESRGRYVLWLDGWRVDVDAADERTRAIRDAADASGAAAGPAPLVAPMPGLVVRVLVAPGETVAAGTPLVVMEAMKMENELRAPAAGVVSAVKTVAGKAVEKGAVLVELAGLSL
jgi:pyruvate carboxylase subunit B